MVNLSQMQLGKFLELKRGYDLPGKNRIKGPYPVVSSSGISDFHQESKVAGPGVITGRYGTIGQVFFVEDDFWPLNTTLYVRDFKGNIPRFVYYFLKTLNWEQFNDKSGVPGVNRNDVHQEIVRVPTPSDQKQIAEILGTLDDKIELNRQMNETLEEMARALFRDWFIDFGPTRRQMDGATDPAAIMGHAFPDDKATILAPLFPARLGEDGLPEGWNWDAVSELADLNPKSWTVKKHPEQIDYLDLSNTKWGRIEETTSYLWSEAPSRAKRILEPGDTIVGTVRPGNGSYALIGREGLTGSTGFAVLRPKHRSVTEFVYLALTSPENIDILANLADGGAYPAINPKIVADTKIVLADSKVIEDFSNLTQSMFAKPHFNEQESQTLAQIRDLLLPKLMSGEIQLKDAPMVQDTLNRQPIGSSQLGTSKNLFLKPTK